MKGFFRYCFRTWVLVFPLSIVWAEDISNTSPDNWWPWTVNWSADSEWAERTDAWGPFFSQRQNATASIGSLRPIFTRIEDRPAQQKRSHWLYPLANLDQRPESSFFHILSLIRHLDSHPSDVPPLHRFEIWPFYFEQTTEPAEGNYRALFPLGGTLKKRFWSDRLDFVLFPLYLRTQTGDETHYSTPWPFVQWRRGPGVTGGALWPLGGHFERTGRYRETFALWPIYYSYARQLQKPDPLRGWGLLPFYTTESGPGHESENYLWPLFGWTRESAPRPEYREVRYLWPLCAVGRGPEHRLDRWLPFYSHELWRGRETNWYLWPFVKNTHWQEGEISIDRQQFLYFLWWNEDQRARHDSFHAQRSHLWPFFSYWNDGLGKRQFQTLSPLEVFFPHNDVIRENYSPLFALYRWEARPGFEAQSAFWNLIVIESAGGDGLFQVGPLFSLVKTGSHAYVEVLHGLFGYGRETAESKTVKLFWKEW